MALMRADLPSRMTHCSVLEIKQGSARGLGGSRVWDAGEVSC